MAEQLLEYPNGGAIAMVGPNPCGTFILFDIDEEILKIIYDEGERILGQIVNTARCRIIEQWFPIESRYGPAVLYTLLGDPALRLKYPPSQYIEEERTVDIQKTIGSTILTGPIPLPTDKPYKIFDITGRQIHTLNPAPGIYFIEVDGEIKQKVVKVR
jgi:hypothetical protein